MLEHTACRYLCHMQVFHNLLGDGRYEQMLASSGLPVTLQWVNTTAVSFEVCCARHVLPQALFQHAST